MTSAALFHRQLYGDVHCAGVKSHSKFSRAEIVMASWISRLIFATLFISGACGYEDHPIEPGRLLQESPIPKVGIFFTSRTMAPAMAYYTGSSSTIVQDDIVKNFEGNDRVTGTYGAVV